MSEARGPEDAWIETLAAEAEDPRRDPLAELLTRTDDPATRARLREALEVRSRLDQAALRDAVLAELDRGAPGVEDHAQLRAWVAKPHPLAADAPLLPGPARDRLPWGRILLLVAAVAALVLVLTRPASPPGVAPAPAERPDAVLGVGPDPDLSVVSDGAGGVEVRWGLALAAGGYFELRFYGLAEDGSRGALLAGPVRVTGGRSWGLPAASPLQAAGAWQVQLDAFDSLGTPVARATATWDHVPD